MRQPGPEIEIERLHRLSELVAAEIQQISYLPTGPWLNSGTREATREALRQKTQDPPIIELACPEAAIIASRATDRPNGTNVTRTQVSPGGIPKNAGAEKLSPFTFGAILPIFVTITVMKTWLTQRSSSRYGGVAQLVRAAES